MNNIFSKIIKNDRGVTLTALVITIIIILILAGISLKVATGDNGLISRAKLAVQQYEDSELEEQQQLEDLYKQLDKKEYNVENEDDATRRELLEELEKLREQIKEKDDLINSLQGQGDNMKIFDNLQLVQNASENQPRGTGRVKSITLDAGNYIFYTTCMLPHNASGYNDILEETPKISFEGVTVKRLGNLPIYQLNLEETKTGTVTFATTSSDGPPVYQLNRLMIYKYE